MNQHQLKVAIILLLLVIISAIVLNMKYKVIQTLVITQEKSPTSEIIVPENNNEDALPELRNLRLKSFVANLRSMNLSDFSNENLLLTMHSYLDNTEVTCRRKLRMGKIGDGGWEICDDVDVRPRRPCIIYSFGISYDFSFDDDAAKVYGCQVYSFDPSMQKVAEQFNRSTLVHFYKIGLSNKEDLKSNWKLNTLGNLRKMLQHRNTVIDVLKMDIESSEWSAIPEMASTGQLESIRQLMVEYHVTEKTNDYLIPRLKAIQTVEKAGFKRYYVHKNPACGTSISGFPVIRTQCYEIHYVRR